MLRFKSVSLEKKIDSQQSTKNEFDFTIMIPWRVASSCLTTTILVQNMNIRKRCYNRSTTRAKCSSAWGERKTYTGAGFHEHDSAGINEREVLGFYSCIVYRCIRDETLVVFQYLPAMQLIEINEYCQIIDFH